MNKKIKCPTHGKQKWRRHVVCNVCGRVYNQKKIEHRSKTMVFDGKKIVNCKCRCGSMLMPRFIGDEHFTARAICRKCYNEAKKRGF